VATIHAACICTAYRISRATIRTRIITICRAISIRICYTAAALTWAGLGRIVRTAIIAVCRAISIRICYTAAALTWAGLGRIVRTAVFDIRNAVTVAICFVSLITVDNVLAKLISRIEGPRYYEVVVDWRRNLQFHICDHRNWTHWGYFHAMIVGKEL
jgi:hypothetical protein